MLYSGLVTGFVSLPTFMTAESSEVLWALLQFDKEVGLSPPLSLSRSLLLSQSVFFHVLFLSVEHKGVSKIIAQQAACWC